MTSAQVVDSKGNKVREVGLDQTVFGVEAKEGLLHQALVRQLANARRGCASTKTRAEVAGGGKKPWRQKGTGRARAGSIRSPLWEGGGVIFGPKPRDYSITMPKKQRVLALKAALSARKDNLVVVQNFDEIKDGKTKEFASLLDGLKLTDKKVLLVVDGTNDQAKKVERSARNIAGLTVVHVSNLNVKELLHCEAVLTCEPVLEVISNRFKPSSKEAPAPAATKEKKAATGEKKAKTAPDKKAAPADKEPKSKAAPAKSKTTAKAKKEQ